MFPIYPYLNINDLNLDYVLKQIGILETEVTQFVSLNAIKYADPIQWNIVQQYEKNTVVIDPLTGTAYISVAPVPSGVALTNTDYWTVVFNLGSFVTRAAQNFTSRWESETTATATFPTSTGEWLVWGDVLYKALTNITAGDTYVVNGNIEHFTIEDLYNAYLNTVSTILAMIGNLDNLVTTDKTSLVNAINEVASQVLGKIGNLDDLHTSNTSTVVNAINETFDNVGNLASEVREMYVNVKTLGAIGDGIADDTSAVQDAIDLSHDTGVRIFFPAGEYRITSTLYVLKNVWLEGVAIPEQYSNGVHKSVIVDDLTDKTQPLFNISNGMTNYQVGDANHATAVMVKNLKMQAPFLDGYKCGVYMCGTGCFFENVKIDGFEIGLILERSYRCKFDSLHVVGAYKGVVTRYSSPLVSFDYCWFGFTGNTAYLTVACPADVLTLVRTFCPSANDYPTGLSAHQCETLQMNKTAVEGYTYGVEAVSASIFGNGNNFEAIYNALVRALKSGGGNIFKGVVNFTGVNIYNSESFPSCHYSEQSYVSMVILETYGILPTNILDPIYTSDGINQACSISSPNSGHKILTPVLTDKNNNVLNIPVVQNNSYIDEYGYMNVDFLVANFTNWPDDATNGVHVKFNASFNDMNVYHPVIAYYGDMSLKKFMAIHKTDEYSGYQIMKDGVNYATKTDLLTSDFRIQFKFKLLQA